MWPGVSDGTYRFIFAMMWVGLAATVVGGLGVVGFLGYVLYRGLAAIF